MHYCLLFYCCFITFYSVLPRSTLCELRFTPCYSTSCYTVLPLVSYVLLRFTLFYSVLLRAFISFHLVLLSATLFYPLRTTFFYFVSGLLLVRFLTLICCYPVPVLLLFSACFTVIPCLFCIRFFCLFVLELAFLNLQLSTFDCRFLTHERPQRHNFPLFSQYLVLHFILFSAL